jgi:hypothetical protein
METALTKQNLVSYQQNNLLFLDTIEQESQLMLTKFKEKNEQKEKGEIVVDNLSFPSKN